MSTRDQLLSDTAATLPLIYIAGPFRGATPLAVRRNVEAARDLGLRVAEGGGFPMIPHTMTSDFDKQLDDQFWLDGTMKMLSRCDGVCLTANYELSSGARAELQYARSIRLPEYIDGRSLMSIESWIRGFPRR
jgi:hypothetical protein